MTEGKAMEKPTVNECGCKPWDSFTIADENCAFEEKCAEVQSLRSALRDIAKSSINEESAAAYAGKVLGRYMDGPGLLAEVQSLRTQLEQYRLREVESQQEFSAPTDKGELARLRRYMHDTSDDMQCLEKCDSYGHEELCPVTNAMAAFRQLRTQLEEKERQGGCPNAEVGARSPDLAREEGARMTTEEKMKRLSPSHHHFELVADPWHADAFVGLPPEVQDALDNGRVTSLGHGHADPTPRRGVRRKVWYSVDWCGNLIQEWGEDTPPGEAEPKENAE